MSDFPKFVQINEEGPREGFQFEKGPISTERKIELIDALSETGLNHIQVASFVNPNRVPGWADADEVVQRYERKPGIHYTALWLNLKGLQRAMATHRLDIEGSFSLTASATFLARNQQRSMEDNIQQAHETIRTLQAAQHPAEARQHHGGVRLQLRRRDPASARARPDAAAARHRRRTWCAGRRCSRSPTPWPGRRRSRSAQLVGKVRERFPELTLALHLHDTRGMGIANAYAGLEMGISIFDSTVAGLGGCPFAAHKGAAGNVCTEDLVFMLDEMGIETGIDLDRLIEVAQLAEDIVGHPLPGSVKMGGSLKALREKLH